MATKWTPKSLSRRIRPYAEKWARPMGLSEGWDLTFDVVDERSHDTGHGFSPAFEVHSDWRYMNGHVIAYGPVVADMPDEDIEKAIVHEYCHVLINELSTCCDEARADAEERVVTRFANALLAARRLGREGKL